MPIIEVEALSKVFGDRLAVDNLSLKVEKGEVLAFLGPNGAGKTTTIRMLAGIIAPSSGRATVAGLRPDVEPERLHEVVGLLTESAGFYDRLTARRNLEYYAGFYAGIDVASQVEKYLRLTGLLDRQGDKVGTFSKGMKQRLALARALLHEPKVLFLDEPTAGLDPEAAQEVRHLIQKLISEGRTVFLSTHNLAEAEYLSHRIAVIRTQLLAVDTPVKLRQRLFRRRVVVRLDSVLPSMVEAVQKLPFVEGVATEGEKLLIDLMNPDENVPELVKCVVEAGGRTQGVCEEQHTLEEVYLNLVKEVR